jgi:uncharacterized repeat protein (TIGR03803 family)
LYPSSLVQGRDGNLYGTSNDGGANSCGSFSYGCGTVFKVTPTGVLTNLYNFCSQPNCVDGYYPFFPLTLGADGNLYGTTQNGGTGGYGTVFRITPEGAYTVLHSFQSIDGDSPDGLVLASDGNFYGATFAGGYRGGAGAGTAFKITPAGALTILHLFNSDNGVGGNPDASLIQGADGNFYGTTLGGGDQSFGCVYSGYDGCGTVFKMTSDGTVTTLHEFGYLASDGVFPYSSVVQASDGDLYGTTFQGGAGYGTVYKSTTSGKEKVLYDFGFNEGYIYAGLVQASDGNLYGNGNAADWIFQITPEGTFTEECVCGGGTTLMQATDGKFYGTAYGLVYSFDMGLGPFITFVVPAGKAGGTAEILGQGFEGTAGVSSNGIAAKSFKVVSDTYMTAVVPAGASTGRVVVTTPSGTLTSNLNFRVIE